MQLPIVKPAPIVTTHEIRLSPSIREPVTVSALSELLNWLNGTAEGFIAVKEITPRC